MDTWTSVVDPSSGVISGCAANAPSSDVRLALGAGQAGAALDAASLLHLSGAGGRQAVARSFSVPVSTRAADAPFRVRAGPLARDDQGWDLYRLCVREP